MKHRTKRVTSVFLAACMTIANMSFAGFAQENVKQEIASYPSDVDVYVEAGSKADNPGIAGQTLCVKTVTDSGDAAYTRKSLLKFSLDDAYLSGSWDEAVLEMVLNSTENSYGEDTLIEINELSSSDWDESVTWNTVPAKIGLASMLYSSHIEGGATAGNKIKVDLTDTLIAAKQAGKREISFELTVIEPKNNEVGLYIASSRHGSYDGPKLVFNRNTETIDPITLEAEEEAFVQAGSDAGNTMTTFTSYQNNPYILRAKNVGDSSNTTRKTIMRFDLSAVPSAGWNDAVLSLQLHNVFLDGTMGAVYAVGGSWSRDTVTWNSFPQRLGGEISEFSYQDVDGSKERGDFLHIDLTDAITEAVSQGETELCIEISMKTDMANGSNNFDFYATGATKDNIINNPTLEFDPVSPQLTISYDADKEEEGDDPDRVDTSALRQKWTEFITGGDLDMTDDTVLQYLGQLDEEVDGYYEPMAKGDKTGLTELWDDLQIRGATHNNTAYRTQSSNMAEHYNRLYAIATAYRTKGSKYYEDPAVRDEILSALEYMHDYHYNATGIYYGNWWHWEIGAARSSMYATLLMYDELSASQIMKYAEAVRRFNPGADVRWGQIGSPTPTLANLLDKATSVALDGVITGNRDRLDNAYSAQAKAYVYVDSGDGLYKDGSLIQHSILAYTGGYGKDFFESAGSLCYVFADTEWAVVYDDGSEQILYDVIFKGIEPLLYNGSMMDSVRSRGVVRASQTDRTRGAETIEAMVPIIMAMPEDQKQQALSMVKYYVQFDEAFYFEHTSNISIQLIIQDLLEDDSITPRSDYNATTIYSGMDRVSHIVSDTEDLSGYGFSIAMSSSRQGKYEVYNLEGKRLWNTSDGMTFLYTGDIDQYSGGFWATIDPRRLPGTTVEYKDRGSNDRDSNGNQWGTTSYDWAGGSTLGLYGSAGVQMQSYGTNMDGTPNGAVSKKSWFMFDEEIVALGTEINAGNDTTSPIQTIIDNRQIDLDQSNKVIIDGTEPDIADNTGALFSEKSGTTFSDVTWANIEGNVEGSDIGYYFPSGNTTIQAMKERRDSNWNTQGPTDLAVSGSYATLWFDHGANVQDGEYEYVILPNKTAEETASYSENPNIEILQNDGTAQAVRSNKLGITGINFWEAATVAGVTTDGTASVTMQREGDMVEIAVAEPTQKKSGTLEVAFENLPAKMYHFKDDTITVKQYLPYLIISIDLSKVDSTDMVGQSQNIRVQLIDESVTEVIEVIDTVERDVPLGTSFADLNLPETVTVNASDLISYEVNVVWDRTAYFKNTYGEYEIAGALLLPEGMQNLMDIKAKATVRVGSYSVMAIQDTTVRDNSSGTGASYMDNEYLEIKCDDSTWNRKSLIKVDISSMPNDYDGAYLTFTLQQAGAQFRYFDIYQLDNDWNQTTVTWTNFPSRLSEEPIAKVTSADLRNGYELQINITNAVKDAQQQGMDFLSFEFVIPEYESGDQNLVHIYSLENQAGIMPPSVVWEKAPAEQPLEDKSELESYYLSVKDEDKDQYTEDSWKNFEAALKNAKEILDNDDASRTEIDNALSSLKDAFSNLEKKEEDNSSSEEESSKEEPSKEEPGGSRSEEPSESSDEETNGKTENSDSNDGRTSSSGTPGTGDSAEAAMLLFLLLLSGGCLMMILKKHQQN